ncbi:peroxiredoxin-like 2A [Babylonia areolata]|uniref:peroxiredoxin-like 2A n=1 Tax=Babylonia areolata TaxID=304850 RepID=UPI003FD0D04F
MGGISKTLLGLAGVAVGMGLLCNLPVNPFVPAPLPASLAYLADTQLTTLDEKPYQFKASQLWEKNGAVIMAVRRPGCSLCREEAMELSSIRAELKLRNVPLYAVVHETLGVEEFSPYLGADGIYLDKERKFYGPQERWMFLSGFLRATVWSNIRRNRNKGVDGNLDGEGRLLGGVFVLGPGEQGILLEHREKEWGDLANLTDIMAAVRKISSKAKS